MVSEKPTGQRVADLEAAVATLRHDVAVLVESVNALVRRVLALETTPATVTSDLLHKVGEVLVGFDEVYTLKIGGAKRGQPHDMHPDGVDGRPYCARCHTGERYIHTEPVCKGEVTVFLVGSDP